MATKKRKAKRRRIATEGGLYSFHGAFKSKTAAQKKARSVHGFTVGRLIKHGDFRYVVMGPGSGVGF